MDLHKTLPSQQAKKKKKGTEELRHRRRSKRRKGNKFYRDWIAEGSSQKDKSGKKLFSTGMQVGIQADIAARAIPIRDWLLLSVN